MKIVDRKTFLAMPEGTVFEKYRPEVFEGLCIKGESLDYGDFYCASLTGAIDFSSTEDHSIKCSEMSKRGASCGMDFDAQMRDALFDEDQLFAAYEPCDVRDLIARLHRALNDSLKEPT